LSIYTAPPVYAADVAAGVDLAPVELGFTTSQVIVDNPTGQWLYIVPAGRYVPPGVFGAILPFGGCTQVSAQWSAPPGVSQPTAVPGQVANLVWLSAAIDAAPSPGLANAPIVQLGPGAQVDISGGAIQISGGQGGEVNVSTQSPPQPASSNLVVDSGSETGSVTLTPPSGATGVVLVTVPNDVSVPTFKVVGDTSQNVYAEVSYPGDGSGTIVAVIQGSVEAITFSVAYYQNSSSLPATAAYISWLFGSGVQQVVSDLAQPLYVQTVTPPSQVLYSNNLSPDAGSVTELMAAPGDGIIRIRRVLLSLQGPATGASGATPYGSNTELILQAGAGGDYANLVGFWMNVLPLPALDCSELPVLNPGGGGTAAGLYLRNNAGNAISNLWVTIIGAIY